MKKIKSILLFFILIFLVGIHSQLFAQNKVNNEITSVKKKKKEKSEVKIKIAKKQSIHLYEKDTWLTVGLALTVAGGGHMYLGKFKTGAVFFWGSYGFMAAGILATISSHSTRDIVVNGSTIREEDHNIKPLSIIGSLFISSGIIFYIGNIIDAYLLVKNYNKRIRRIRRYNRRSKSLTSNFFIRSNQKELLVGQQFHF